MKKKHFFSYIIYDKIFTFIFLYIFIFLLKINFFSSRKTTKNLTQAKNKIANYRIKPYYAKNSN